MIRVLIADDHPLVREGLKKILKGEVDISVVGVAANGAELLSIVQNQNLDVVVMDFSMPGRTGLDVLKELRDHRPKLPVLILSMHPEERFAVRVLKAGAAGYLTKESAPEELVKAIHKVAGGGKYVTPTLAEKLACDVGKNPDNPPHETLSDREYQIMCMIASGTSVKEISEELSLSINTINTYRARILEKMDMKTNIDLTHYALRNGLID